MEIVFYICWIFLLLLLLIRENSKKNCLLLFIFCVCLFASHVLPVIAGDCKSRAPFSISSQMTRIARWGDFLLFLELFIHRTLTSASFLRHRKFAFLIFVASFQFFLLLIATATVWQVFCLFTLIKSSFLPWVTRSVRISKLHYFLW